MKATLGLGPSSLSTDPGSHLGAHAEEPRCGARREHRDIATLGAVERVTVRTSSLLRAVIATSLAGHWIANTLFDADQYRGNTALLDKLNAPFLVQAALALVAIVVLSMRGKASRSLVSLDRSTLAAVLVGLQVVLFVGLEASERLALGMLADGTGELGVFGVGFLTELLVAVGTSLLLVVGAEATRRLLATREPRTWPHAQLQAVPDAPGVRPPLEAVSGSGGDRAPPP
jgi:hypothetical protein